MVPTYLPALSTLILSTNSWFPNRDVLKLFLFAGNILPTRHVIVIPFIGMSVSNLMLFCVIKLSKNLHNVVETYSSDTTTPPTFPTPTPIGVAWLLPSTRLEITFTKVIIFNLGDFYSVLLFWLKSYYVFSK